MNQSFIAFSCQKKSENAEKDQVIMVKLFYYASDNITTKVKTLSISSLQQISSLKNGI